MAGVTAAGVFAAITAVAAVGGTVASIDAQKDAQDEAEKANRAARATEQVKSRRQKVRSIQANRIQAAEVFAQSTNAGTGTSSGTAGAIGGLNTQTASNIGFASSIDAGRNARMDAISASRQSQAQAGMFQTFANAAPTLGQGAFDIYSMFSQPGTAA